MNRFVPDASVVLTWCFPDEDVARAQAASEFIAGGGLPVVRAFWAHEILNALLVGERRKRITPELTEAFLEDLGRLPVEVQIDTGTNVVFTSIQALSRKHGLTAYDAAYLELAVRGSYPLATLDDDMRRAALAEGLLVIEARPA